MPNGVHEYTEPITNPPYEGTIIDVETNHAIAIPDRNTPQFHILKPDQVRTLFRALAQSLSQLVDVEVSCNDDHAGYGIILFNGKAVKEEDWKED